jgi:hypothetical protein
MQSNSDSTANIERIFWIVVAKHPKFDEAGKKAEAELLPIPQRQLMGYATSQNHREESS